MSGQNYGQGLPTRCRKPAWLEAEIPKAAVEAATEVLYNHPLHKEYSVEGPAWLGDADADEWAVMASEVVDAALPAIHADLVKRLLGEEFIERLRIEMIEADVGYINARERLGVEYPPGEAPPGDVMAAARAEIRKDLHAALAAALGSIRPVAVVNGDGP